MLNQVLREIETAQGSITLSELSRKLEITPTALEGMLQFWVRKGRIKADDSTSSSENVSEGCSKSCSGTPNCVYVAKMPKTYSIPNHNTK